MTVLINAILALATLLLVVSAFIAIQRIAVGPSQLDRSIGSDLLVAIVIGAVGIWATYKDQDTEIIILLALSMIGFTGAVSIARMVSERVVYRPKTDERSRKGGS